ncbi:hypothetical protein [Ferrimonas sediminum]|nr:hypothetical protein [Ferrimonas sediminum]
MSLLYRQCVLSLIPLAAGLMLPLCVAAIRASIDVQCPSTH